MSYSFSLNEELSSRSVLVVPLRSSFVFRIRIGASSKWFWQHSSLSPCQQNSRVLLWSFLCCISTNIPLLGTRETLDLFTLKVVLHLHKSFCMEFFPLSALKCQYFPFLIVISCEELFSTLCRRMLHKLSQTIVVVQLNPGYTLARNKAIS